MQRRDFLQFSFGGLSALALPWKAWPLQSPEPHFFLQLYIYGGMDPLFLFDARPKAMTEAGLIHDYVKEEGKLWMGENGGRCLATSYARKLEKYRSRFSIVNGVCMATSFDGHSQNVNFLFTGSPFGGESFVAHMNQRTDPNFSPFPLDALQSARLSLDQTNGGATVPLTVESAKSLIATLKHTRPIEPGQPAMQYLRSRFAKLGSTQGRLAQGGRAMLEGYLQAPDLAERFTRLRLTPQSTPENAFIELMSGFFRQGIAPAALLQLFPDDGHFDTHAGSAARIQSRAYLSIVEKISRVFEALEKTPFDQKYSLFDVTTVMVTSEFGRTLRQIGLDLNETGTDHNVLCNSFLIGGKGIRGGQVLGASDWQTPTETLSKAHRLVDPNGLKLMARPFDFNSGRSRQDLPETFDLDDYITMSSIANTLYATFNVPQEKWRTVKRDGPKAKVLSSLLA